MCVNNSQLTNGLFIKHKQSIINKGYLRSSTKNSLKRFINLDKTKNMNLYGFDCKKNVFSFNIRSDVHDLLASC